MKRIGTALTRRGLMTAAAGTGALAATSQLVPSVLAGSPGAQPAPAGNQRSGYRLTEHVKRYYQSALV